MHHRTVSQPIATTSSLQEQEKPVKLSQSSSQPAGGSLVGAPTLIDFLHAVPAPLVVLLVRLAPPLASLRYVAQILSWQTSWIDCWLLLAAWWAAVLFTDFALRYFLFAVICSALVYSRRRQPPRQYNADASHTMTEVSVQTAMRDLAALLVLLPSPPTLPAFLSSSTLPSAALFRACALASIPYLILTYLVPLRVLVGLLGTIILTYRAPFAQLLRAALWRSSFVRWPVYRSWACLTGIPITYPIPIPPVDAAVAVQGANSTVTARVRFAFMVYENQRWWMGLDWTAALLPGERPSWCSASQAALPPPAAFALPAPTTAFLPVNGPPDACEQRTATWAWAEPEWRVVVWRDGDSSVDAVEGAENTTEETDADGWVYADNKWENHSGKGGLGKYTRYRRWTRIAILTESTERVGPGPTGVLREGGQLQPLDLLVGGETREKTPEKEKVGKSPERMEASLERHTPMVLGAVGSGLKQRLHAAVSGSH